MSWSVTVNGHEDSGPDPELEAKVHAAARKAIDAAIEQGLTPRSAYTSPGGTVDIGPLPPPAEPDEANS